MRRLGKFYISRSVIDHKDIPEVLNRMGFMPYRAEYLWHKDAAEYIGESPRFKEIPDGAEPTEYYIHVSRDDMKTIKVTAYEVGIDYGNEGDHR